MTGEKNGTGLIDDVSDTALWVAVYRAQETERPDALFRDPLAAVLAGERGRRIAEKMSGAKIMAWAMAMRTSAIDRMILRSIELGVDTVLNLGAGLDTRPYRMNGLASAVRWIEVDFPHMIELKNTKLAGEKPICRLERIACDLSDRARRKELLAKVAGETKHCLVITEGVLGYLEEEEVRRVSADIFALPTLQFWIMDYIDGGYGQGMPRKWGRLLKLAPFKFKVPDWFGYFKELGWRPREVITTIGESERVGRRPPFVFPVSLIWIAGYLFSSPAKRKKQRSRVGYTMLERV